VHDVLSLSDLIGHLVTCRTETRQEGAGGVLTACIGCCEDRVLVAVELVVPGLRLRAEPGNVGTDVGCRGRALRRGCRLGTTTAGCGHSSEHYSGCHNPDRSHATR